MWAIVCINTPNIDRFSSQDWSYVAFMSFIGQYLLPLSPILTIMDSTTLLDGGGAFTIQYNSLGPVIKAGSI